MSEIIKIIFCISVIIGSITFMSHSIFALIQQDKGKWVVKPYVLVICGICCLITIIMFGVMFKLDTNNKFKKSEYKLVTKHLYEKI